MSRRNEQLEVVLAELRATGIEPEVRLRVHTQVRWCTHDGQQRMYVVASTAGGGRGVANARAGVRRMLRQDGVLSK